jgi:hypothetical protein
MKHNTIPTRGSLDPGLVECQMMVKIARRYLTFNTNEIEIRDLGKDWPDEIPDRPAFPAGYFDEGDNEERENAEVDEDDSDSEGGST